MTQRNSQRLTDLQQAILDILWTKGPATSDRIRRLLGRAHPLSDSSVRTLLRRLEARGYLSHHLDGKVFVYSATLPRQSVAARAVKHVIDRFWSGSVEQFLLGMVDEQVLTKGEIQRLARKVGKK